MKSEPSTFAWEDLLAAPQQRTVWDGVRNYQARNYLRDDVRLDARVLFYQSRAKPLAVRGTMRVVRAGYADPTQFELDHLYADPTSSKRAPRWFAIDVQAEMTFETPVTLSQIRDHPACSDLALIRPGNRLSVLPVPLSAMAAIVRMGEGR